MLIGARTAAWSGEKLPYDAEVEWIGCSGTQYIDTGFYPNNQSGFKVLVSRHSNIIYNIPFIGAKNDSGSTRFIYGNSLEADVVSQFYGWGIPQNYYRQPFAINTVYTACLNYKNSRTASWNDFVSTENFNIYTLPQFSRSVHIFAVDWAGITSYYSRNIFVHYLEISQDSDIVMQLVPVRINSGSSARGYMYDRLHPTGGPLGNGLWGNAADNNNGFPANLIGPDKT